MAGEPNRGGGVERKECRLHSFLLWLLATMLLAPAYPFTRCVYAETHTYPGGQKPSAYKPLAPATPPPAAAHPPTPTPALRSAAATHLPAATAATPRFPVPKAVPVPRTPAPALSPLAHAPTAEAFAAPSSNPANEIRNFAPNPGEVRSNASSAGPSEPRSNPSARSDPSYGPAASAPRYSSQMQTPLFAARSQFAPRYGYANPYSRSVQYRQSARQGENGVGSEHLPAWMREHQNQSPEEQEKALRQEPGFNRLDPQQQQNLINTLHRLDAMPPEQRARTLARIENMERLSPQMKQAVRESARQLGDLPPDRKRMVQKAFRDLRDMPPEQRQAVMNSPQFAGQFSAQERSIMGNLLAVEPYQHLGPAPVQPQYGRQ